MDIENMHPFCLPFGFCHDATSSSIAADFDPLINNNNGDNMAVATSNDINSSSNNNSSNKDKIRFKTSSPSDELFRHLNQTNHSLTSGGHSLLNSGDLIIGSTSTLDVNCGDSFYSLELDINIDDPLENGTDIDFITNDDNNDVDDVVDDDVDNLKGEHHHHIMNDEDDWFSSQYSLFSPTNGRRKSLIRTALSSGLHNNNLSNQVFQHVVDPIDIKSSPTLAQLNLNSNDDPTEGLWGESTAASTSTNQIDLLSNCTSITGTRHHESHHHHHHHHHHSHHNNHQHAPNHNLSITCNHLNHHHNSQHNHQQHLHQHHHHHDNHHAHQIHPHVPLSSSLHNNHHNIVNPSLPNTCLNVQHHQQSSGVCGAEGSSCNGSENRTCGNDSCSRFAPCNSMQASRCNGLSSFRKPDLHQNSPTCCANLLTATSTCNSQQQNLNNSPNLKPSTTLNQLNNLSHASTINNNNNNDGSSNNQHQSALIRQQLITLDKHNQQHKACQQRSASPALVTSSSSPLSSSASSSNGLNENRSIDNKLKENIEYLTALLCNGNKLDYSNQQPSISSTMVRSYATLAHSLSTGPKLLERQQLNLAAQLNAQHRQQQQQQHQQHQILIPQQKSISDQQPGNLCTGPTNEASPCADGSQHQISVPNISTIKRPYSDQWLKLAVESSVSPADSTESQVSSLTTGDRLNHHCPTTILSSCPSNHNMHQQQQQPSTTQQQQQPNNNQQTAQTIDQMRQRSSELKVLSSLLNSNKCSTQVGVNVMPTTNNGQAIGGWLSCQQHQPQQPAQTIIESSMGQVSHHTLNPMQQVNEQKSQTSTPMNKQQQQQQLQEATSIPPTGKPITLTPIAANNGILIHQQPQVQKPKVNLFAQPASPSASSTASSGTSVNTGSDIGSTSTPAKRQRSNLQQSTAPANQKANGSNRSARPNSMSTDCSLSSHDEGFSSQIDNDDCGSARDSDDDDDIDSDDESFYGDYTNSDLIGASISDNVENKWTLNMGRTRRNGQKRYFWQYNVQSKGPKGTRICSTDDSEDPFVLPEASDPVFSNDCQVEGVKHSGKARRGDGNDLTPNPRKLLMIGLELKKLGKIINELAPVTDLPVNARNKTRKEKNKLASRACRLKKKAQHEANKIKLYGLQREHQQVVLAIYDIRKLLNKTLLDREAKDLLSNESEQQPIEQNPTNNPTTAVRTSSNNENVNAKVEAIAEQCSMTVAGQTSDYVNSVLEKVVSGCIDGGLQT